VGPALETLPLLAKEGLGPFDFVFIDADKPNCAPYFEWALKLTRPGSVIIVDNVVRNGAVCDENSTDQNVLGVRRLVDMLANEPRVNATAIQTVGSKGYDGLIMARVTGT
jgi:predicted O-methyltransferase YrrM